MSGFGDYEPDDAYDTEPADPEQVARKIQRLRLEHAIELGDWDDLLPAEQAVRIRIAARLLAWLRRQGGDMTGIYYADMLDVLRAAGCAVAENHLTAGWQTRARSSGGFPSPPLAVFWHHTASSTTPANDLGWMINGSDDAPIGNLLVDRDGVFWPIAAGASNCAGKGGPATFSRGTIPVDSGNTRGWQLEVANNGVGEPWPAVQIDAYFAGSNALNAHVGNQPSDVITHGGPDGWAPDRKIDPATAGAVTGDWWPRATNSSGTWNLADIQVEAELRADWTPPPDPGIPPAPNPNPPREDDAMMIGALDTNGTLWVGDGIRRLMVADPGEFDRRILVHGARFVNTSGVQIRGWPDVGVADGLTLDAIGRQV